MTPSDRDAVPATLRGQIPEQARTEPVFVRFVVGSDGEHHRELTGIVTEARFLRDPLPAQGLRVIRVAVAAPALDRPSPRYPRAAPALGGPRRSPTVALYRG